MSGPREVIRIFVKFLVLSDKLAATRGKEPVTEFIYIYRQLPIVNDFFLVCSSVLSHIHILHHVPFQRFHFCSSLYLLAILSLSRVCFP